MANIPKVSELLVVVAVVPVKPPPSPNPNDGAALVDAGASAREGADCVVPNPNVGAAKVPQNKIQHYLIKWNSPLDVTVEAPKVNPPDAELTVAVVRETAGAPKFRVGAAELAAAPNNPVEGVELPNNETVVVGVAVGVANKLGATALVGAPKEDCACVAGLPNPKDGAAVVL